MKKELENESSLVDTNNMYTKTPNLSFKARFAYTFTKLKTQYKEIKKKKERKKRKKGKLKRLNISIFKDYLTQAGYDEVDEHKFSKILKNIAFIIISLITTIMIILFFFFQTSFVKIPLILIALWTVFLGFIIGVMWLFVYIYLDMRIYQRTKQVEEVLPDFLQLTSANISAGMPIDQALWFAVRPKFGVLAKEIEDVAKSTIAGADLEIALKDFAKKYKSKTLKRSINLIVEGMKAGGELAELLSKIAIDIQETKLIRKDIAASVMTYVIFISFASVAAAPFLFALSTQLLGIVQSIMGGLDFGDVSTGTFNLAIGSDGIDIRDFKIFSIIALAVSAIFSASIVSIIRNGNVREGAKMIPIFIVISLIIYLVANQLVGGLMGGFI